jgi:phosphocarrier protein FPr
MVGIVVVSHSARLAEGVVELAREMAGGEVPIAAAGGLDEPGEPLGTDAMRVMAALQEVGEGADGGTLVLMDLGSAILSAETALDFLDDDEKARVRLVAAPLVEGAVAAAAAARAGATLDEAAAEAARGLAGKEAHLGAEAAGGGGEAPADDGGGWVSATAVVGGEHGLHARPAAAVVRAAAGLDAEVRIENVTAGRGPAAARSLTALSTLGALRGHTVRILARGPQAAEALEAVAALVAEDDGAPPAPVAGPEAAAAAAPEAPDPPEPGATLRGVPASPGQASGPARVAGGPPPLPDAPAGPPDEERAALAAAREVVAADLRGLRTSAAERAGAEAADILDAQLLLLGDEALVEAAEAAVAGGAPAARAWDDAVREAARGYEALDDEYLRARATDLVDVGRRVIERLAGAEPEGGAGDLEPGVLVAGEVGAADAAALDPERVAGMATAGGGPTSHAAIIARALGIPAVAGLGPAVLAVADGTPLLIDGDAGTVVVAPDEEARAAHEARREEAEGRAAAARARAHEPAATRDGRHVEVAANAGAPGDVERAVAEGADGVGLFRTEFLFMGRADAPDEEEQRAAYAAAAAALAGRRLVLRTLDAGADKPVPYLGQPPEENPFLGVRGLRLSLARPELLLVQLRAALQAAAQAPLGIMFPMVSEAGELREALDLLDEARRSLADEGRGAGEVEVGAMVEVPAAALAAAALASQVDFLSIGTNDLVQYTMAAERGNAGVARLSDPVHPAVLRLVAAVTEAAARHACRVAVCGEAGSDPAAIPLLVGLGVDELSVAPVRVPLVKEAVRALETGEARALAARALELEDAAAVRELVDRSR